MMRRFALAMLLAGLVLVSVGARSSPLAPKQLVFGPSIHLLDPSRYPANDKQYARQPLPDGEPSVAVAADGTVWVAAIHLQHGVALWRGRFGHDAPTFAGMPDHGIGGDDVGLAVGGGTPASLYVSSIVPITTPVTAWRVAATACPLGAISLDFGACAYYPHLAYGLRDRPWMTAYGRSTAYLSYVRRDDDVLAGHMTVQRTDDGGRTWRIVGNPVGALPPGTHGWPGALAVDPRSGAVSEIFVTETPGAGNPDRFNRLVVATSRDGGVTWRDTTIYEGGPEEDDGHMWPSLAADAAGRLYATWSDGHGVYLATSGDGNRTWSAPVRVDVPSPGLRVSVMPFVAAGAAGHAGVAWYGGDTTNALSPSGRWRVVYAESFDGGHTWAQTFATPVIHRGPVCTKGDACPWVQRQLLDNLGLALDPQTGRAAIAYSRTVEFGDYLACRHAANCPQTYYVEERTHP